MSSMARTPGWDRASAATALPVPSGLASSTRMISHAPGACASSTGRSRSTSGPIEPALR
jgi:hypothetical protein